MSPGLRKVALTVHVTAALGWIGAVVAYLALVVTAMNREDAQTLRAAWLAMELIGWLVIVPLSLASVLTGLVMALGTRWGLFQHYWVAISLALTVFATVILLQHLRSVSVFAAMAAGTDDAVIGRLRSGLAGEVVHAGIGLLVLIVIQILNVYKPRGLTPYGRRKWREDSAAARA